MDRARAMVESRSRAEKEPTAQIERCQRLVEEADDLRYEDPRRAVAMAEKARDLSAAIDPRRAGAAWWALQADAWAVLGSALRSMTDLRGAEEAFNVALRFLYSRELRPVLDPLVEARLEQRAAYLRCDQKRFDEALELIDDAITIYEDHGAGQRAASAIVDRGLILGRADRKPEAVNHFQEALDRLDPACCPRNFLAAIHNVAIYLLQLADGRETLEYAVEWLETAERWHRAFPENVNRLKLQAVRAYSALRLGQVEKAIDLFWQTQEEFGRLEARHDQAFILLRLAAIYLGLNRPSDVLKVAGQLFPVFREMDHEHEAYAALRLFYDAALAETTTLALIERVLARLAKTPFGCQFSIGLDIESVPGRIEPGSAEPTSS